MREIRRVEVELRRALEPDRVEVGDGGGVEVDVWCVDGGGGGDGGGGLDGEVGNDVPAGVVFAAAEGGYEDLWWRLAGEGEGGEEG